VINRPLGLGGFMNDKQIREIFKKAAPKAEPKAAAKK
jgi:hypothetical protein